MTYNDKFLIGIVAGILLLVVIAFVITLIRPEPMYQAEDNPKSVAHNYLLALQKQNYERAYGYLSPTLRGYPASAAKFTQDVLAWLWTFRLNADTTLAVTSARTTGSQAVVKVRESRFYDDGLLGRNQYTTTFEIRLQIERGEWKIVDADEYFLRCWKQSTGCQ